MQSVLSFALVLQVGFFEPGLLRTPAGQQAVFDATLVGLPALDRQGLGLVRYLRSLTLNDEQRRRVEEDIFRLGSENYDQRRQAMRHLLTESSGAIALLRLAAGDNDLERRRRAELCLGSLEGRHVPARTEAVLRLLAERRPPGASAAVYHYLSDATEDALVDQALSTLLQIGLPDAATERLLLGGLRSPAHLQRGAAALVLGHHGSEPNKIEVRQLLVSPSAQVRFLAAYGLATAGDPQGQTALAKLAREPGFLAAKAERTLSRLSAPDRAFFHPARELSPSWQARQVVLDFFEVISARRLSELKKITAVPFSLGGTLILRTQDEFDRVFTEAFDEQRKHARSIPVVLLHEMRRETYAAQAPESELTFLEELPGVPLRIVLIRGEVGGREESGAVLVRCGPSEPRILGIGHVKK